jgi:hypothetical protein
MIIDAHLHLDQNVDGTAAGAARELGRQIGEAGISRVLVLHLETQPWPAEEVAAAIAPYPAIRAFVNVHPGKPHAMQALRRGIEELGFIGLKLHPRLQEFGVDDEATVQLVRAAGEMGVPVLVDAFPDGTHLMHGFAPVRYAMLARQCPGTRIIWAHMGGHHVLDFMMLAKRLPNVYFDLSYSLLYYRTSGVPADMIYAMRSMRFDRIFYGSDYPDRPLAASLRLSLDFLERELEAAELRKIMFSNARQFFGWDDL